MFNGSTGFNITIDPSCTQLINALKSCEQNATGGREKSDITEAFFDNGLSRVFIKYFRRGRE